MIQPFGVIKIRVCALVSSKGQVAVIERKRGGLATYTVPGGNVDAGEDLGEALRRELREELGLDVALLQIQPKLIAVQDQMVTRPGNTPPPRKLHCIFGLSIDELHRSEIALLENDDLGVGEIVWRDPYHLRNCKLYPAIQDLFLRPWSADIDVGVVLLNPMNDQNYRWT